MQNEITMEVLSIGVPVALPVGRRHNPDVLMRGLPDRSLIRQLEGNSLIRRKLRTAPGPNTVTVA